MINSETLANNLTPQAAERLLMLQMLTAQQKPAQPEPAQPEPAPKPKNCFPQLGEAAFVKRDYLGSEINRKLIFTGVVMNMVESKWVLCGIFVSEGEGWAIHYAKKEDIEL